MAKKAREHVVLEQDHAARTPQIWVAQEAESGYRAGSRYKTSRPITWDPLPPTRLYLLKFLQPPKTVPPARDQECEHMSLWATFHIKTTSVLAFCAAWSEHDKSPWKWDWLSRKCSCVFISGWGQRWASNHFFLFPNNGLKRRHFLCRWD